MATPASHSGHINKLYVRNLFDFKGDHVINLEKELYTEDKWIEKCTNNNESSSAPYSSQTKPETGSLVAFLGDVGTGKSSIQHLVSAVNILKFSSNGQNNIIKDQVVPKHDGAKSGLFCADVITPDGETAYYGIYASAKQPDWRVNILEDKVSCTPTFALFPDKGIIYVLDGDPATLKQYKLPDHMSTTSHNILTTVESCFTESGTMKLPMINLDNQPIISGFSSTEIESNVSGLDDVVSKGYKCAFVKSPLGHRRSRMVIREFAKLCQEHAFQLIMVIPSLKNDDISFKINPVVRFWKTLDSVTHANPLPESLLLECRRHKDMSEVLVSNSVVIVEGESDANLLSNIFDDILNPCTLFKGENKLKWMRPIWPTIINANGKDNIPKFVDILLKHAHLGLPHFVICDLDAVLPGSAGQVVARAESAPKTQRRKTEKTKSSILNNGKSCMLFKCIMYLHPENNRCLYFDYVSTQYESLKEKLDQIEVVPGGTENRHEQLHTGIQLSTTACREIHGWHSEIVIKECPFEEHSRVQQFCKKHLLVYAWSSGDIESTIATAGYDPKKQDLRVKEVFHITENMIKSGNPHLENLFDFIEDIVQPILESLMQLQ